MKTDSVISTSSKTDISGIRFRAETAYVLHTFISIGIKHSYTDHTKCVSEKVYFLVNAVSEKKGLALMEL